MYRWDHRVFIQLLTDSGESVIYTGSCRYRPGEGVALVLTNQRTGEALAGIMPSAKVASGQDILRSLGCGHLQEERQVEPGIFEPALGQATD